MTTTKFCIFCGETPSDKNKEHVIPRWLIELTGNPKRKGCFGKNEHSFDQFVFPSCKKCNDEFSNLEAKSCEVMKKILVEIKVSSDDLLILLDWFDKVRVGLWLGFSYTLKDRFKVGPKNNGTRPNFFIKQRVGLFDRALIIQQTDCDFKRINFIGADTISFNFAPSVFNLIINNFYFTNISSLSFLSQRLGFPYINEMIAMPGRKGVYQSIFSPGNGKRRKLVINEAFQPDESLTIFQPILCEFPFEYKERFRLQHQQLLNETFLDFKKGIERVFIESKDINCRPISNEECVILKPKKILDDYEHSLRNPINLLKLQNKISDTSHINRSQLSNNEKKLFNIDSVLSLSHNNILLESYNNQLKEHMPNIRHNRKCEPNEKFKVRLGKPPIFNNPETEMVNK